MTSENLMTKVNEQLTYLYSNGKGEAGLEVGVDAGLSSENYIQVPISMKKRWAARLDVSKYKQGRPVAGDIIDWDGDFNSVEGATGWITKGQMRIVGGKKEVLYTGNAMEEWVEFDEFHIEPFTYDDMVKFYTVNKGHIDDDNFEDQVQKYIHAVRFWGLVGGLVASDKNVEYKVVDDPKVIDKGADAFASFAINYSANAWTAAAARTTSWKKTNHATGGTPAIGLPRRWMQKENFWSSANDPSARRRQEVVATSAFYMATHAVSVHAVLAQLAPGDDHHWVKLDPSFGFIETWDIGESIKVRMNPRDQVAGTSMVTDSLVVLKMLAAEGLAPCLEFKSQIPYLVDAHQEILRVGMVCGVYKSWYFEGYPGKLEKSTFTQRNNQYFDLICELAIIAVKFYTGSTIAASPTLQNVARQSHYESIKANWAVAGSQRMEMTSSDLIKVIESVRGVSGSSVISGVASKTGNEQIIAVTEYNQQLRQIGAMLRMENIKQLDPGNITTHGLFSSTNLA